MIETKNLTVEREGGYVSIAWDGGRLRLTPTAAAKLARKLQVAAVEIAKEVIAE